MNKRTASVILAGAMLIASCSDGQADTISAPVTTAPTTTEAPATTVGEEPTTTTTEAPSRELAEYEGALLTLADMPEGWTEQPPTEDDENDCLALALEEFDDENAEDLPSLTASFSGSTFGPIIQQSISIVDRDRISTRLDVFAGAIEQCNPYTDTDGNTFTFAPMSLDDRLDETFAVSATISGSTFPAELRLVIVRKGDAVMLVTGIGIPAIDVEQYIELLDIAVERLDRV